jgi:RNA polymerase sigma-70 factor (ECF subfamily)
VDTSDGALVLAARSGNILAMESLVRRYTARVAAACWARVGRAGPVEDLVQETFLRAHRSLLTLDDPARFGPWLHAIAVRASLDWLKRRERGELPLASLGPDGVPDRADPEASAEQADRRRLVQGGVESLPEIYREAIVLFYYEKQSYKEMSAILEITPAAVNARLTKARALLRERLGRSP